MQVPAVPAREEAPAEPEGETCTLRPEARAELNWLPGPGGTAVRHPNLGFSFALPEADFEPAREERPLMLAALHDDERTVSHPFFDDFSRSFVVVRVVALEGSHQTSLASYVRGIGAKLEAGARQELGEETAIAPWKRSAAQSYVGAESTFDRRLHVLIRAWPLRSRGEGCTLAVVLVGASISPQEIPAIVDGFEVP